MSQQSRFPNRWLVLLGVVLLAAAGGCVALAVAGGLTMVINVTP